MKKIFYISIFLLLSAFDSYPLIDSMHYNWVLYEYESEYEGKKCYITSKPIKSDSDNGRDRAPYICLLYTSPSPRDRTRSRMPSSA